MSFLLSMLDGNITDGIIFCLLLLSILFMWIWMKHAIYLKKQLALSQENAERRIKRLTDYIKRKELV